MKQRMRYVFVLALATGSALVGACNDAEDALDDDTGGSAGASGSSAGNKTGGSGNKAGSGNGNGGEAGGEAGGAAGMAAGGGADMGGAGMGGAGMGGAGDGGMGGGGAGGASGAAGEGGANGGAPGDGGAGGMGGPQLVYACGSDTLPKKLCSAFVGANCTDPTVCADCVTERTTELADFLASFDEDNQCAACLDKYDDFFQCAIDAYESGNVTSGIECLPDYGADLNFENCGPLQGEANTCHTYLNENECPATWPPT